MVVKNNRKNGVFFFGEFFFFWCRKIDFPPERGGGAPSLPIFFGNWFFGTNKKRIHREKNSIFSFIFYSHIQCIDSFRVTGKYPNQTSKSEKWPKYITTGSTPRISHCVGGGGGFFGKKIFLVWEKKKLLRQHFFFFTPEGLFFFRFCHKICMWGEV